MMHNEHVIICGLGHVGFRVFELLSSLGMQITVISDRTADDKRDKAMASGCRYLEADAQSDSVLLDAGIREAHCIMALTDDDLANISIINDARRLNPAIRIIARMYDTELGAHIAREFRICNIFSTSSIARRYSSTPWPPLAAGHHHTGKPDLLHPRKQQ
jgi:Trk K+ transport system NAD-binding subunit